MLQELLNASGASPRENTNLNSDLDFVMARFDEESGIGSNYGLDCANVLRDLWVLVQRLRIPLDPTLRTTHGSGTTAPPRVMPLGDQTKYENRPSWNQGDPNISQQQIHVEQGHVLYDELVSWMADDWHSYGGYLI